MRKFTICIFLLINQFISFSQDSWDDFTGEQKAFFHYVSRRTENLNAEIFPLFQYTDSIPYINDTLPDYKYVEKKIVRYPERLILHKAEMARKSTGLVSDLATKFALWELDEVLHYRNTTSVGDQLLKDRLKIFEKYVLEEVPQSAVRTLSKGQFVLEKSLIAYYAPTLTIGDKKAAIKQSGYSLDDQMLILNAIMVAEQRYVELRSKEIMLILGVNPVLYINRLSAVGDGDNWSEVEAGFKTPYNRSLPDDIALFNFETKVLTQEKSEIDYLAVNSVTKRKVTTSTAEKTVIHFDVAGYHPERQTTLVIQKGDRSYILYGKNEHRLVSPDSTYGEGATYWRLMWELENVHIALVNKNLYGKRGYEYWIEEYGKRIEKNELLIKKTEYRLDQLRRQPNPPPKIKKKKIKKKNLGNSDQDGQGHPTAAPTGLDKQKNTERNTLIRLNTLLENQKSTRKKLIKEMEEAYFILIKYETLLDKMQKNMGYAVMEYDQENDMYVFRDGATFNYRTQDFTFAKRKNSETFEVLHVTFGKSVFARSVEENFVHIAQTYEQLNSKFSYKTIRTNDEVAKEDSMIKDSIQSMELFLALMNKDVDLTLDIIGGGVLGGEKEAEYYRDSATTPVEYDKDYSNHSRALELFGSYSAHVNLKITFWKNPMLPYDYGPFEKAYSKAIKKNSSINKIDIITGYKAQKEGLIWIESLKLKAELWLKDGKDKSMVLRKLNKVKVGKVRFLNGRAEIKLKV